MPARTTTALLLAAGLLNAATALAQGGGSATLDAVRARGQLRCGVSGQIAGFSMPDHQGVMRGLDADGCRGVAAAVFGDATKVKFVPTTPQNGFSLLESRDIDLLVGGAVWTVEQEAGRGFRFAGVNDYDGTAFLVRRATGAKSARQLDGATICLRLGGGSELAVGEYFHTNGMKWTPVRLTGPAEVAAALRAGSCAAYADDGSALAAFRTAQPNRDELVMLPEVIGNQPLGYLVRKGDDKWFDIVRWTHFAELIAEQLGIDSRNVDRRRANAMTDTTMSDTRELLGLEGGLGKALGVNDQWAYNVIRQVGSFSEIWDRNLGALGVPRGLNNLWSNGGLQYAPLMR